MLDAVRPYRKAIAGFLAPGIGSVGLALLPGSPGGQGVTGSELVGALSLMLVTAAGVYLAPKNGGGR